MIFGERLEYLRNENHMTQKQLASQLGMTAGMISSYERGVSLPDVAQLKKICDYFNVSPEYFLNYTNIPLPINHDNKQKIAIPKDIKITPEMLKEVCSYIEYLTYKKKNKL